MHTAGRLGVRTLLRASGICNNITTAEDIAYRLAPRLNAAGRMSHAKLAFDLLRTDDPAVAERLAETLNVLNSRRQQIEQQIYKEAVARIESQPSLPMKRSLLLADPNWHEGVLGIVASKIATRYHRPVILLAAQDGIGKGSGRSIPQVDLFAALNHCSTLLEKFGGHRMAGGLTVQTQKINRLRDYFEEAVCEQLSDQKVIPELIIDSEILFDEINDQLLNELEQLEPYGEKNPAPVFFARNVRVTSACRIGRQHRRMTVCQDQRPGATLNAIHFNSEASFFNTTFFDQLAFRLHWNRYKGNKQIQLVVEGY
jgi:single-stranded-DNA-specific exonuclease